MENFNMNLISLKAVSNAANFLLLDKGYVTTLDIKKLLRSTGYYAVQHDVSAYMNELLYIEKGWDYYSNGKFRIYFKQHSYTHENANISFSLN